MSEAAKKLGLLDDDGVLLEVDSLSVLMLVSELERTTKVSIPTREIRVESFESIEAITDLLQRLAAPAGSGT